MTDKEPARKVRIDVNTKDTATNGHNTGYYLDVDLPESALRLKGELFVAAVRRSLREIVKANGTIFINTNGPAQQSSDSQMMGRIVQPDLLTISDQWRLPT